MITVLDTNKTDETAIFIRQNETSKTPLINNSDFRESSLLSPISSPRLRVYFIYQLDRKCEFSSRENDRKKSSDECDLLHIVSGIKIRNSIYRNNLLMSRSAIEFK